MTWRTLESAVREPVAVYATTSSGGAFNVRVALRQRVPGEARNAITACMGARFQPDRDLIVMSGMRTLPLDPSLPPGSRVGSKAGYDLTWPFGQGDRIETRVPAAPKFAGKRFPTVEAAIADGPKFFEELMAAVGSRDGREVVRDIEALRDKLALDRDGEGRYFFKPGSKPSA
jgi:3-polyprenyl-4-hydroxybenzoate decarboxylase